MDSLLTAFSTFSCVPESESDKTLNRFIFVKGILKNTIRGLFASQKSLEGFIRVLLFRGCAFFCRSANQAKTMTGVPS